MTIITGPIVPEQVASPIIPTSPTEPSAPPETQPIEQEQPAEEKAIQYFTAPAPVRRKKISFFGTLVAEFLLAFTAGGALWLGANFGGETFGNISLSILDFLLNG